MMLNVNPKVVIKMLNDKLIVIQIVFTFISISPFWQYLLWSSNHNCVNCGHNWPVKVIKPGIIVFTLSNSWSASLCILSLHHLIVLSTILTGCCFITHIPPFNSHLSKHYLYLERINEENKYFLWVSDGGSVHLIGSLWLGRIKLRLT